MTDSTEKQSPEKQSKVKRDNYIVIQGWMLTDLKLKGNELLIYACIYGFSQAEDQSFTGSLQYLADWTNSTKQGVIKNLKSLVEKGFIQKSDKYINGVKFCEYHATEFTEVLNKVERGIKQSLTPPGKQSLTNNISLDTLKKNIGDIIGHLNGSAGTAYKPTTKKTVDLIKARMNEGFSVVDFYTVIDKKCAEWRNDEKMAQFLRPETLFGTKFESYLNAPAPQKKTYGKTGIEIKKAPEDDELKGIL